MRFSLFGNKRPEEGFWVWFEKNEQMLYDFQNNQQQAFGKLKAALCKVHPDLTFEFGPEINGVRDFVISAGGLKDAFGAVKSLYEAAPEMDRWNIIAFRPRREPMPLSINGVTIKPDDIEITIETGEVKPGVYLYIRGYEESQHELYLHFAFLMLDQALGEYDVTMKVGVIEIHPFEHVTENKRIRFEDLAAEFDEIVK